MSGILLGRCVAQSRKERTRYTSLGRVNNLKLSKTEDHIEGDRDDYIFIFVFNDLIISCFINTPHKGLRNVRFRF